MCYTQEFLKPLFFLYTEVLYAGCFYITSKSTYLICYVDVKIHKQPLGRPRRRWVDNIRMDLQEVGCGYMDWIGLAQDRDRWRMLVSAVMNLQVP